MDRLFKIILILLTLYLSGCCVHVNIMYKSNQGLSNVLGQKTDAKLPIVGDDIDK